MSEAKQFSKRSVAELASALDMLEILQHQFYDTVGEDMVTQEEFNDFAKKYPNVARFGLLIEATCEVFKDELNRRGIHTE